ncbi:MAG: signal peptide peptidase SppA [Bacteroidales bacterium]|nr:signal peptide peptidase SppA [Bacteroidales bacterium]
MKNFFKIFFASLLAFVIGSLLCMFIFLGIIGAMLSFADTEETVIVKPNSVLRIMLDKPVGERGGAVMPNLNLFGSLSFDSNIGLNDLVKGISHAATDPDIRMIYMDLSTLQIGAGHLEELRNAVLHFKDSGKPIIVYGDNLSQGAYYLASVADKIYLNPFGSLSLQGVRSEIMFYKRLLEKLQVDMQIIRHGKYKSAVEPFMLDQMSPENREQNLSFLNSIWHHWLAGIAKARGLDVKKLQEMTDNGLFTMMGLSSDALSAGLVDGLMYKDELLDELVKLTGEKRERDIKMVDIVSYSKVVKPTLKAKDKIAVIYADGEITMGKGEDGITAWNYANILRNVRSDSSVKAVVFRVNSPGGSAQASEIIARELALVKEVKPVVVSMGNYAASGGYWISMPSNIVITNSTCLTGSIGVFGIIPNMEKGLKNHLGITVDVAKSAQSADFPSGFRALSNREKEISQASVENIYAEFVKKVAESRNIDVQRVDDLGQGRVWTGLQAIENNLADLLGGLTDAIDAAAKLAGLDNYRLKELPAQKDMYTQLMAMFKNAMINANSNSIGQTYRVLAKQLDLLQESQVLARIPFDVEIY